MQLSLAELAGPDPARALARLRAVQPVAWVDALGGWLATGYDVAVGVLRDAGTFTVDDPRFSTARVVGPSMLSLDGPAHVRHRAPFGAAFRPAEVSRRFGTLAEGTASDLVDRIRPRGAADLRATVAGPLSVAIVADALGLRTADASTVLRWYAAIVGAVSAITAGDPPPAAAGDAMRDLAAAVADHHDASLLADARGSLEQEEVVSNAAVLMFGGIETTEAMISNALWHLLTHPTQLATAAGDPDALPAVVEESLRLEPAAAMVDRYATRDVVIGGAAVVAGDLVRVSVTGANRDPVVFGDPDVFDPGRSNVRSQVAFARGPHTCIAMDLARLETVVALRTVLERLPALRLTAATAPQGLVFRKPPSVPVAWRVDRVHR